MIYVSDIIDKCNGRLLCGDISLPLVNFSKDTRTINKGDVYIGIKGDAFDGNSFYLDAFDKGARVCILDNINENDIPEEYRDKTIVLVENTIKAIGLLAKYKRSLYDIPVVAVTGSVGKTSTKEMIASVLGEKYRVLKTEANYNNHIGLPLTILKLNDEDILVVEMGMNNLGEISYLTDIAKPTIGVITNVGTAHIGNLGSRENILKAKLEIVEGLSGPLIINNDNDMMHDHLDYIKSLNEVITIGIDNDSDYMASDINYDIDGCASFDVIHNGEKLGRIELSVLGEHNIYNALSAISLAICYGISFDDIKKGLKKYKGASRRLEYKGKFKGASVYDDYGHHPTEIMATSKAIHKKKYRESWVIFEAHTYARAYKHKEEFAKALKDFDHIIVTDIYAAREENIYGITEDDIVREIKKYGKEAFHISSYDDIKLYLSQYVHEGDLILTLGAGNVTKMADLLVK